MSELLPPQPMPTGVINPSTLAEKVEQTNILPQYFSNNELSELLNANIHNISNTQQHPDFDDSVTLDPAQFIFDLRESQGHKNIYDKFLYRYTGNSKPINTEPLPILNGYWGPESDTKVAFTDRLCDGYTVRGDLLHIRSYTHSNGQTYFLPVIADIHSGQNYENSVDIWDDSADVITVEGEPDMMYLWHGDEKPIIRLSRSSGEVELLKDGEWLDVRPMTELIDEVARRRIGALATEKEARIPIAA